MPKPRPTLLFLVTEDWYFVSHRLPLARAAVDAGYRVVVATRVDRSAAAIEAAGCEVVPIRLERAGRALWGEAQAIAQLVRLYRSVRPDIAHHVALKPVLYGSLAAWLGGRPRVVNALAGLGFVFTGDARRKRALRFGVQLAFRLLLGRRGSVVLLQNPDDRAWLVSRGLVPESRTALIRGSGVDLADFVPTPEPTTPTVLLPARMLRDKGVEEFVQAAGLLQARGLKARFVLAGGEDPANPAAIERDRLLAWQEEGLVEWWGHRTDMAQVMSQATIVCLPSYREGLPKALLEGAASGRALVATDVPGCREVVRPGQSGVLVPPRDPVALAQALETLLGDPESRQQLARGARTLAEGEFGCQRVVTETLALYDSLLDRRSPG